MQGKKVSESMVELLHSPMPDETNNAGMLHGGHLLKLIDNAGAIAAGRHSRSRVVTASLERMDFLTPIKPGELIHLKASLNMTGKSSMEIGVRVEAEDMQSGNVRHAATCYMTMVALDEQGHPQAIPPLIMENEEEERRFNKARERRRYRTLLRSTTTPLHLQVSPHFYAICQCPRHLRAGLLPLFEEEGHLLALIAVSPAKLCPGLDACSLNLQNTDPETEAFKEGMSLVVRQDAIALLPEETRKNLLRNDGWRCLAFYGPNTALSQTGILSGISTTLANANISIFSLSTFDGNYILLKNEVLEDAVRALRSNGYVVQEATGE